MSASLEVVNANGIAMIWLNRPDTHNAIDEQLIAALTQAMHDLDADPEVGVIVLAGRGRSFCAGADLGWMRRAASFTQQQNIDDARSLAAMLQAVANCSKTTIARVHGAAIGGGLGLVCACDIAIASTDAVFATSEVKLGLIPATIGPYVVRVIGARQALRYFQSAERIEAKRAREIGLVHEAVSAEQLDRCIADLIVAVTEGGMQARAAAKALINAIVGRPLDAALIEDTAQRIAAIRTSAEAREGIDAFLEKRAPAWRQSD